MPGCQLHVRPRVRRIVREVRVLIISRRGHQCSQQPRHQGQAECASQIETPPSRSQNTSDRQVSGPWSRPPTAGIAERLLIVFTEEEVIDLGDDPGVFLLLSSTGEHDQKQQRKQGDEREVEDERH